MSGVEGFSRYCGIDVGKNKHMACVLDPQGAFVVKPHGIANGATGYRQLRERLAGTGGPAEVLVGLEATGCYWYSLHEYLVREGYRVIVLNPIQTAGQARKGIRKSQTDKIDARHIAMLIRSGEGRAALVPGNLGMICRQLTRLRYSLVGQAMRTKLVLWSRLHPVWPEYEALFYKPLCQTGQALLAAAPTPADTLAMDREALVALLRRVSRGRFAEAKADAIRASAAGSIGMRRGLDGARLSIRTLLAPLAAMRPVRQQLEADITHLLDQVPRYLKTLPGAGPLQAVSLFGETDPFETFRTPEQLVAFAGLDPVVQESGAFRGSERRISKRGSPFLRRTLWQMALRAAYTEGDLREYFLRKRRDKLHHLAAITAVSIKLCHVAWRIMTDRRDYLPKRPMRQHLGA